MFEKLDLSAYASGLSTSSINVVEKLANIRILYVESNEMNRMIGREMLEGEGAVVVEAISGAAAIDLFNAVSEKTFSAILMDVDMPGLSGPETAKIIRNSDKPWGKTIPIIALTSNGDFEDITECCKNGMNAYLTKPIKISELTNAILTVIGEK